MLDDRRKSVAREHLIDYIRYTKDGYQVKWYHKVICDEVEHFLFTPGDDRLMLFVPPQHGKSEIVSRRAPTFAFGMNPDLQMVTATYAYKLATKMSRDVQRIMGSDRYHKLFPGVGLRGSFQRSSTETVKRQDEFEIVGHEGRYMSVGIMGGLTGNTVDILNIDDPVKDPVEAFSKVMRDRLWDWYEAVADSRLHKGSKVLLTMTRWHEDDLAGRLLKAMESGGEKWRVIRFPALKEDNDNPQDIRQMDEALWEEKHGREKLDRIRETSTRIFVSLYQQRPSSLGGNIFHKDWFKTYTRSRLDDEAREINFRLIWHFTGDTAYEEKIQDDPSAFIAYTYFKNNLYIAEVASVREEMPRLIKFAKEFALRNGYTDQSRFRIEPKASGKSLIQMLRETTNLNVMEGDVPTTDKVTRANLCVPFVESGRVYLLEGASWKKMFLDEVTLFPNAEHDDIVDCFTMSINESEESVMDIFDLSDRIF